MKGNNALNEKILRNILETFSKNELMQIIKKGKNGRPIKISDTAKKSFIINKIFENIPINEIIKNEQITYKSLEKLQKMNNIFEYIFTNLNMEDLKQICNDLNRIDIFTNNKTKTDIIHILMNSFDIEDLWKSKRLRDRFTPKYITKTDIELINRNINSLKDEILMKNSVEIKAYNEFQQNINNTIKNYLYDTKNDINKFISIISFNRDNNYDNILDYFYNESLKLNKKISLNDIYNAKNNIKQNINQTKLDYLYNSLELMLTHYFLTNLRNVDIKPDKDMFWRILKEEFNKIKQLGDRAEIPTLRKLVCDRMKIAEQVFDEYVEEGWIDGSVRLDIGAPIGQRDVKYLITKEGTRFFYITI